MGTIEALPPICLMCTRVFDDQPALQKHTRLKSSTEKQCKTCSFVTCDDLALERHHELLECCTHKVEASTSPTPSPPPEPPGPSYEKEPTTFSPAQPVKKDLRTITRIEEPVNIDKAIYAVRQRTAELKISRYVDKSCNTVLTYKGPKGASAKSDTAINKDKQTKTDVEPQKELITW